MTTFPTYSAILEWDESTVDNTIQTQFEGYLKIAKLFSNQYINVSLTLLLTTDEYNDFLDWVRDYGYDTFTITRYVDSANITARLRNTSIQSKRLSRVADQWIINCELVYLN